MRAHHVLVDVVSQAIFAQDVDRALLGDHVPPGPRIEELARFMDEYRQQHLDEATRVVGEMVRRLPTTTTVQLPRPLLAPSPSPQPGLVRLVAPTSVRKCDLDAAVRGLRCTSSTLVYAAWALFLSRITTEDRVGFRISLSGRTVPWPQAQSVVGCLVDSIPFSTAVPRYEHVTVHNWLAEVHKTTLDLLAFDGLGFALPQSLLADMRTNTTNVLCFLDMAPPSTANWKYTENQKHNYQMAWYAFQNGENVATWFEIQRQHVNEDWARSVADVPGRMLERLVKATEETSLEDLLR